MGLARTDGTTFSTPALKMALSLLADGFWPIPITSYDDPVTNAGKAPVGKEWGKKKHTPESLLAIYTRNPAAGVGLKLGPDGTVIDVDVDDPTEAAPVLARLFPDGLPLTWGWSSTRGFHLIFQWDERLLKYGKNIVKGWLRDGEVCGNQHYTGLEIRLGTNGQLQSVVPPTVGDDGQPRVLNGHGEILPLPESFFVDLDEYVLAKPQADDQKPLKVYSHLSNVPELATRVRAYLGKIEPAVAGSHGHDKTFGAACRVGPGFDLSPEVCLAFLDEWNQGCDPPWSDKELSRKVAEAYRVETRRGWLLETERERRSESIPPNGRPKPEEVLKPKPLAEIVVITMEDVIQTEVQWLWRDRIPLGKITLLAGDPKLGKSFVTLDIAARVSTGADAPAGGHLLEGDVILLTAEDDLNDTVKPRLVDAGADCRRIHVLEAIRLPSGQVAPFCLSDVLYLEMTIKRFPNTKLVILDPVTSFIGGRLDDHKNTELRSVLGPLRELASRYEVAILLITHLNKGTGTKALNRVMGSLAYTAVARASWLIIKDEEDPKRRLVLSIGGNLAEEPSGLAYRIVSGRVEWESLPIAMSADEALEATNKTGSQKNATKVQQAGEWLVELLQAGEMSSDKVLEAGLDKKFSRDVLFQAKKHSGIKARKLSFGGGWVWYVEESLPKGRQNSSIHSSNSSNASDSSGDEWIPPGPAY